MEYYRKCIRTWTVPHKASMVDVADHWCNGYTIFCISHLWVGWKYLCLFLIISRFYLSLPKLFCFNHLWVMQNFLSFFFLKVHFISGCPNCSASATYGWCRIFFLFSLF